MSHLKRPWDYLDNGTSPFGDGPVKRRAVSHLISPSILSDASDSSDQDMTSVTVETTSTALSSVRSILSTPLSPRKITSPASVRSGSVSEHVGERGPDKRVVCFGMVRFNDTPVTIRRRD